MQESNDEIYINDGEIGLSKMSISADSNITGYDFNDIPDEESTSSASPTNLPALPESPLVTKKSDKDRLKNSLEFFNTKKRVDRRDFLEAEVKPDTVAENIETEQQTTKDKGRKKLRQALSGSQESFSSVSTLDDLSGLSF